MSDINAYNDVNDFESRLSLLENWKDAMQVEMVTRLTE